MSVAQLEEHRRVWVDKPVLARVYAPWFDALIEVCPASGRVLEVGAGPGFLSEYGRPRRPGVNWVASDLLSAPWNDLVADAHHLPIGSAALDAVVGLDVLHHLARPGDFLGEAARVLRPGGRLAVIEPWVTPLSYPIYRFLHQEGCTLAIDPWDPFPHAGRTPKSAFDGDAAIPWRMIGRGGWDRFGLESPQVVPLNAFAYLLSLGFKRGSLLPRSWVGSLNACDRLTSRLAFLTGLRALLVWRKPVSGASG